MKKTIISIAFSLMFFYVLSAQAELIISPDLCDDSDGFDGAGGCWYYRLDNPWNFDDKQPLKNPQADEIEVITGVSPISELFKDDVDDGESGSYAGSYSVDYSMSDDPTDPDDATITYVGGKAIDCPECFLLVKDGNTDPNWYLFDLSYDGWTGDTNPWDGTEKIVLENFWPGTGAISHVAIYATPIPAAAWFLGSGLVGLVLVRRRRR